MKSLRFTRSSLFVASVWLVVGCGGGSGQPVPGLPAASGLPGEEGAHAAAPQATNVSVGGGLAPVDPAIGGGQKPTVPSETPMEQKPATMGSNPGGACLRNEDCVGGGICWTAEKGFPGGYCTLEGCQKGSCPAGSDCFKFQDKVSRCIPVCQKSSDCRKQEGYVCDSESTCWPDAGTSLPGGECQAAEDCRGGAEAGCIRQEGFVGGYCLVGSCADDCPQGSLCKAVFEDGGKACIPSCEMDSDCRPGYVCNLEAGSAFDHACVPGCSEGSCPAPYECRAREIWSGHVCVDTSRECSQKNPAGDCPAGQVCQAGGCAPFACRDNLLEPNESAEQARPLPEGETAGLQICSKDQDWFTFEPTVEQTLYRIGIRRNFSSGALGLRLVDAATKVVETGAFSPDDYHPDNALGPTDLESISLIGAKGSKPYFVRVAGENGAVNDYALSATQVRYRDGAKCKDLFSVQDCQALTEKGEDDPAKLIPFPAGNPADPYLGDGVNFLSGLVQLGNTSVFVPSARRWARRELIMAIRYALHEVQQRFPGTAALSVGDIGVLDGTTPDGHPNGTHEYGGNVDLAYFIRDEAQRQWGNLNYRQICCDAAELRDWRCVDTDPKSKGYGTCLAGSESTHIVDIPRTALFLAKLAGTGRMRVVGVEAKIEAELNAELDKLLSEGAITAAENRSIRERMATANDDPSWVWHFNHMHLSLCYRECPAQRSAAVPQAKPLGPWAKVSRDEQHRYLLYWMTGDRALLP